ncbi:MAG: spore germination protein [Peptococcaceae bacterium]|nr:spore germination protein [Peptococcaceae bacterium]
MDSIDDKLLSGDYAADVREINRRLRVEHSFDLVSKHLRLGEKEAVLYFVDGFIKDEVLERILAFLLEAEPERLSRVKSAANFAAAFIPYTETDVTNEFSKILASVLSGTPALLVEGLEEAVLIDVRTYPVRGMAEPEDDRVLRGARDGFVETLIFNTALIRRRIRDTALTVEVTPVGTKSKTDVAICYMIGLVNPRHLSIIKEKLNKIAIESLTMGQESLAECLLGSRWYNPFPRVRYTERPDAAAASLYEGSIILIVDNSPAVMILPTSIFDFLQDSNDYYFTPLVGSYLRLVRMLIFFLTVFLTPVWYLLVESPELVPEWLSFIFVREPNQVPIFIQLLLVEFILDGLKLAALNTPTVLSNSFSIVGALILGDFAVKANWLVAEVVLYMAFVAIATFTQPSYELGYAFKLFRLLFLVLIRFIGPWGLPLGVVLMLIVIASTKTPLGYTYLYPLIPFNGPALMRLLIRQPISRQNT